MTPTPRSTRMPRELRLFIAASLAMGMAYSIIDATFNNFLNDRFALSGLERSFLEFPRELPGLLVVFASALLWFLCSRRLAVVAMLLGAAGSVLIGFASPTYTAMVFWLFIYSLGQHIFLPLASTIGMELAREGRTGRRLGQLNALRNLAAILGSFVVFFGFKHLGLTFHHTFVMAAMAFVTAALLLFAMKPEQTQPPALHLKLHREYRLFYALSVLYGSRKQLFITFAPWVLVTVFHQPTQTIATLLTLGGVIGIVFQPLLGWATDHLGERIVLASEAVLLVFVCTGYGFAGYWFSEHTAFLIACGCFLLDQMLMSVNMARAMYMKKIARDASHVQPALTMSVSIDHIFSITVALIGGAIWNRFGFQYVFLLGACIALGNLAAALQIRFPHKLDSSPLSN
ncbi:MAG TPA: MFS transporter [Deltaproteobacteria bacterium]|nr:MFS transporter [Deltaproteobacteria bacterium]HPR55704.1 MFS transporter [Deltaproteobacteria bacterium]HXK47349.1 MFS transporter [Deltaproteobacteria bacterium]